MSEHVVAEEGDIAPGERTLVELDGTEIGVFRMGDQYYAYPNWCPHQGGPVCEGYLTGTQEETFDRETLDSSLEWTSEGEILNCPWHGWEFDVRTGEALSGKGVKLPSFSVTVEDGDVVVSI